MESHVRIKGVTTVTLLIINQLTRNTICNKMASKCYIVDCKRLKV
jgi:hypothetical protein